MAKPRILIAGGCSFTQVPNNHVNWPVFLRDKLNLNAFFDGAGSSGNDIISKRIIFRVNQCLQKYKPENLLVGVMWSGVVRKAVYKQNEPFNYFKFLGSNGNNWYYDNPVSVGGLQKYYLINSHYNDALSNLYYKHFFDDIGNYVETIENILKIQWFLKNHNIKYFFTVYHDDSLDGLAYKQYNDHPDVKFLRDQIDFSNFLPIDNMYDWNLRETPYSYTEDNHPTTEMSEAFVDKVIIPHLKNKGYIE